MASFKICIYSHQQRSSDGKFPVSIRVTWKRQTAFIKTGYYVTAKQVTKDYELKDAVLKKELNERIDNYEFLKVTKIGKNIDAYTAKELADYFVKQDTLKKDDGIDFIEFCEAVACKTKNSGTASLYRTTYRSLKRFTKKQTLSVYDINAKFLNDYETWLMDDQGLTLSGLHLYMKYIRALFYKAKAAHNDEDKGEVVIAHNPFKKYKLKAVPATKKRNIKIDTFIKIRDLDGLELRREILARDVFVLSFYLLGVNTIDLYYMDLIEGGRLTYNRTKTKDRRQDGALMSVKITPEIVPLLKKYRDKTGVRVFNFHNEYSTSHNFNKAVNKGLKEVNKRLALGVELTTYFARHSFATFARNICHIDMLDIHEALVHASDNEMKVTDIYLDKDWSVVDNVQRKVLDAVKDYKVDGEFMDGGGI
jgi:integrase